MNHMSVVDSSCNLPALEPPCNLNRERLQVVGYLVFTASRLALHISKVAVAPSCRRRGIATALVQVFPFDGLSPLCLTLCCASTQSGTLV
jgi:ribosomal protein S18 acetylase RimI-like enzyme